MWSAGKRSQMSTEEIQHLYELLDKEQFKDKELEGLRRLLDALEEQVTLAQYAFDSHEACLFRPSDGRLVIFGPDPTTRIMRFANLESSCMKPAQSCAMAEEMHPKMLSKGCGGVLRDAIGDRSPVQWSSDPRNPEGIAFPRPSAPPLE